MNIVMERLQRVNRGCWLPAAYAEHPLACVAGSGCCPHAQFGLKPGVRQQPALMQMDEVPWLHLLMVFEEPLSVYYYLFYFLISGVLWQEKMYVNCTNYLCYTEMLFARIFFLKAFFFPPKSFSRSGWILSTFQILFHVHNTLMSSLCGSDNS